MKKVLLALFTLMAINAQAQTWRMVITMTNGDKEEISTEDIRGIKYVQSTVQQEDKNADQIIIKEIYNGGVLLDDGSKSYHFDKCIILYNNCPQQAVANNLCFGFCSPYNAQGNNNNYSENSRTRVSALFLPLTAFGITHIHL